MKHRIITTILITIMFWICIHTQISVGRCLNDAQDGKLYNGETYYNYITYKGTNAKENDIVLTVCMLNLTNLCADDIVYRGDIVILRDAK